MSASLPENNEQYGTLEYWNDRYRSEEDGTSFDWFKSYQDVAHIIRELIPDKSARILMLGCGNSKMSEGMYDDGYQHIVNVDYSPVLIEQMKERHKGRPKMEWCEMDVRSLQFSAGSFDVAIDKGTMDAMMTEKGDVWDPPPQVIHNCNREVDEVLRVLKDETGLFIYITFGQPHFRKTYLTRPSTSLEIRTLGEMFHYYLYILRR